MHFKKSYGILIVISIPMYMHTSTNESLSMSSSFQSESSTDEESIAEESVSYEHLLISSADEEDEISLNNHPHYIKISGKPDSSDYHQIRDIYRRKIENNVSKGGTLFLNEIVNNDTESFFKGPKKADDLRFLNEMLIFNFHLYESREGIFQYFDLKSKFKKKIEIKRINDINTSGTPFIFKVCAVNNYKLFKYLLTIESLDINQIAHSGSCLLHVLLKKLNEELCQSYTSPFKIRFKKRNKKMLKRILKRDDLSFDIQNNENLKPLDMISKENRKKINKIIYKYRPYINHKE